MNWWQLDRVRNALNNYRLLKARNGKERSWELICQDVLLSPVTQGEFPEDGSEPDLKPEALRRFANGISSLRPHNLEDIKRFLISAGALSEDELNAADKALRDALTVHNLLGNHVPRAQECLSGLHARYVAQRQGESESEDIDLFLSPNESSPIVLVEERVRIIAADMKMNARDKKDNWVKASFVRQGYGVLSTRDAVLNIFVCGSDPVDRVQYIQAIPYMMRYSQRLYMLRAGAPVEHLPPKKEPPADELLHACNMLVFASSATVIELDK